MTPLNKKPQPREECLLTQISEHGAKIRSCWNLVTDWFPGERRQARSIPYTSNMMCVTAILAVEFCLLIKLRTVFYILNMYLSPGFG